MKCVADLRTKNKVIHEIKKSNKIEIAHEWQLKYYLYVFERNGILGVTGILEYPTLRKTQPIELTEIDREIIRDTENKIKEIISSEKCPAGGRKGICKNCSYYDFCFSGEDEL